MEFKVQGGYALACLCQVVPVRHSGHTGHTGFSKDESERVDPNGYCSKAASAPIRTMKVKKQCCSQCVRETKWMEGNSAVQNRWSCLLGGRRHWYWSVQARSRSDGTELHAKFVWSGTGKLGWTCINGNLFGTNKRANTASSGNLNREFGWPIRHPCQCKF